MSKEKHVRALIADLESFGVKFIPQKPYQTEAEVDGQKVKLPFTNMSGMTAIVHNENGEWRYFGRFREENALSEIAVAHKIFVGDS